MPPKQSGSPGDSDPPIKRETAIKREIDSDEDADTIRAMPTKKRRMDESYVLDTPSRASPAIKVEASETTAPTAARSFGAQRDEPFGREPAARRSGLPDQEGAFRTFLSSQAPSRATQQEYEDPGRVRRWASSRDTSREYARRPSGAASFRGAAQQDDTYDRPWSFSSPGRVTSRLMDGESVPVRLARSPPYHGRSDEGYGMTERLVITDTTYRYFEDGTTESTRTTRFPPVSPRRDDRPYRGQSPRRGRLSSRNSTSPSRARRPGGRPAGDTHRRASSPAPAPPPVTTSHGNAGGKALTHEDVVDYQVGSNHCPSCDRPGHELVQCIKWTVAKFDKPGCIVCNTLRHDPDTCPRVTAMSFEDKVQKFVVESAGRPGNRSVNHSWDRYAREASPQAAYPMSRNYIKLLESSKSYLKKLWTNFNYSKDELPGDFFDARYDTKEKIVESSLNDAYETKSERKAKAAAKVAAKTEQ